MGFKRAKCKKCRWYAERRTKESIKKARERHESETGHTTERIENGALLGNIFSS